MPFSDKFNDFQNVLLTAMAQLSVRAVEDRQLEFPGMR